ncbi:chorismate synthase [Paucilactobacillus suebicus]|uniref:Chorismate synthase n=1 Tax=Paucilactobacillus suebicus DSM 5007 = KCTC 3549 TaxID=1423807 RepID=A0A0R1W2W5_9LACO|nr:chorismate synthase [Paucilactobacillus suebicus]KRM10212.1 chorismate synthase [Paucilactobacillus suebicus DSM 5007 = KCTC 3549]
MRYVTAGESHGPELTAIIEGIPAGLEISVEKINDDLKRRQQGYGRGNRMKIETDQVKILNGIRHQKSLGSPITLNVTNRDHAHWGDIMSPTAEETAANSVRQVTRPRPGHADLVGGMKYRHTDLRNVLERSSARETTMRVAVGSLCKQLLSQIGVEVLGFVKEIGGIQADSSKLSNFNGLADLKKVTDESPTRTFDEQADQQMRHLIDKTKRDGDTLGGVVEVIATGMPAGLGSYVGADTKLDAKLAASIVGINAFKGVEFGDGFKFAHHPGSEGMDEIFWDEDQGFFRKTNHLGGFEGGMTNGQPIVVKAVMKPIPTLYKPLMSVDVKTKESYKANVERSDTTAVTAAAVVAEAMVSIELAKALLDKFDTDSIDRMKEQVTTYLDEIKHY